jgi:phosphoenolpyruvate synthase/pyruvate phosphate dikinase
METYLNICSSDDVLETVIRCYASLWTSRAILYRADKGVPDMGVSITVIVQAMVDPVSAGVVYRRSCFR